MARIGRSGGRRSALHPPCTLLHYAQHGTRLCLPCDIPVHSCHRACPRACPALRGLLGHDHCSALRHPPGLPLRAVCAPHWVRRQAPRPASSYTGFLVPRTLRVSSILMTSRPRCWQRLLTRGYLLAFEYPWNRVTHPTQPNPFKLVHKWVDPKLTQTNVKLLTQPMHRASISFVPSQMFSLLHVCMTTDDSMPRKTKFTTCSHTFYFKHVKNSEQQVAALGEDSLWTQQGC